DRPLPDWEAVEKELRGRGVTLRLLWLEYLSRHPEGYRYTQFCAHFHACQRHARQPTRRRQHRAGEALEVDYAGMTLSVIDKGVVRQAQVFVACLPCSDLTYAEASWTQGHEDWLGAHVRAFAYIGGCPKKVIPDNLKTGVTDANYWDPVLNRSYHAFGRHHNVAIVPARVRKPRDKPSAENAVRLVEMWVLAPLRHRQFFSLAEANAALAEKIEEWNNRPFAPPRDPAMAKRTPDKLRTEAAALGLAIGTYADRLLDAREHPEQAVRACLGVLRLAGTYGKERLELACERALAAGVASSRYVERLLKADRRHPFLDAHAENGLGEHGNLRGPAYYN